jgi:tetratricopeptide (TPR) repeat protein
MTLITIKESPSQGQPWNASISFNNGPPYPATIHDPFSQEQEEELEWYFEEHLRFPFTNQKRAQHAATSIQNYGENLFNQIFADRQAYSTYKGYLQAGLTKLQIEIAGSPAFHALHWEALKDPDLPQPLSLQTIMVRKNLVPSPVQASVRPSPTINLLIVTARPSGKQDVGYRTISRPMVEALHQAGIPVQIEVLRPGTYAALDKHLQEVTARDGVGHYHVIHFDLHGAVLPYSKLQQEPQASHYVYQERYGRPDLQPYEGERAFLFFEEEQGKKADPVEASELATLLINHQIPIAILNACQSGKQVGASETSLGSRLMQAGVQLVLAMGYSVTVSAAALMMRALYQQLFANRELSLAICAARQELYNQKERRAYFNQTIKIEDWLLPVVYQNQPQSLHVRPFTPEESNAYYRKVADRYNPAQPGYGFVGRDLDILQIEKLLLTSRNILLVQGMGGAGKSTLLHHLGEWWQTTGLVEQVFYFGYDEKAWTRQQIMTTIARRLLSKIDYISQFQPLSQEAQQAFLARRLGAERHLLILDNLESITGQHMAIQHTLSPKEQEKLHQFLIELMGGRTLVLLGSRASEAWLARETFAENIYELAGLDPEATSVLANLILARHKVSHYGKDPDLLKLLKLLDGFPLALEVILANLARQTPTEVLTALQSGDTTLQAGKGQARTENILRCVDYSYSNLAPDIQSLLLCLAPFTSVIFQPTLDLYVTALKQQSALASLPFERWQEVIQGATDWGLLTADTDIPSFLRLQPVLPYFLRIHLSTPVYEKMRNAIELAFRELYDQLGLAFRQYLNSKDPQERQIGQVLVRMEYENLSTATRLALDVQVSILGSYNTLSNYINGIQAPQQGLVFAQTILQRLNTLPKETLIGPLGVDTAIVLDDIARWQMELKQYADAKASYQKALELWLENTSMDADTLRKKSASIYHQLGRVAQEERVWKEAKGYYEQALQICIEYNDRYSQASTYHQLGNVAQKERAWEEAKGYYEQALQIFIEYNDRYSQASTYHNLGAVAQEERAWEEVKGYYEQALQIFIEYNDRYSQASTYHQLGRVAQEERVWEEAKEYYEQALQIYIEYNDRYEQASTYHNLGIVAQEERAWEEAKGYYEQALQIYIEYNDRYEQSGTYHQLGRVAQEERAWEEAKGYYEQALELYIKHGNQEEYLRPLYRLAQLWKETNDVQLPTRIAPILNREPQEVEQRLQALLDQVEQASGE